MTHAEARVGDLVDYHTHFFCIWWYQGKSSIIQKKKKLDESLVIGFLSIYGLIIGLVISIQ